MAKSRARRTSLREKLLAALLLLIAAPFELIALLFLRVAGERYKLARLPIVTAATPAAPQGADNTLRRLMPLAAGHVPAQRPFLQHFVTAFVPQLLSKKQRDTHFVDSEP